MTQVLNDFTSVHSCELVCSYTTFCNAIFISTLCDAMLLTMVKSLKLGALGGV